MGISWSKSSSNGGLWSNLHLFQEPQSISGKPSCRPSKLLGYVVLFVMLAFGYRVTAAGRSQSPYYPSELPFNATCLCTLEPNQREISPLIDRQRKFMWVLSHDCCLISILPSVTAPVCDLSPFIPLQLLLTPFLIPPLQRVALSLISFS